MNDISKSLIFVIVNLILIAVVVGYNLLIVFHSSMSNLLFGAIATVSGFSCFGLIVVYIILGEIHESSKIFVRSWKLKRNYPVREKEILYKLFKSCRLNRLEMGSVGCFKKLNVILLVGKIFLYTVKLLMILKPYSNEGRKVG